MVFQTREDSAGASSKKWRRIRSAASISALAAACAASTIAKPAFAEETVVVEEEDADLMIAEDTVVEESVPNRGLLISGVVLLGATYGASAIVAANSDYDPDDNLYIPVAGPWIDLAEREDCEVEGGRDCDNETTYEVLLVADGIGQAIGALQIIGGFVFPAKRTRRTVETAEFMITPRISPTQMGVTAAGTFF